MRKKVVTVHSRTERPGDVSKGNWREKTEKFFILKKDFSFE